MLFCLLQRLLAYTTDCHELSHCHFVFLEKNTTDDAHMQRAKATLVHSLYCSWIADCNKPETAFWTDTEALQAACIMTHHTPGIFCNAFTSSSYRNLVMTAVTLSAASRSPSSTMMYPPRLIHSFLLNLAGRKHSKSRPSAVSACKQLTDFR